MRGPGERFGQIRLRTVFVILAVLATSRPGSGESDGEQVADRLWPVGHAYPVEVEGGRARIRVPTPGPGSRVLVIASTLARGAGPFGMRLEARPAPGDRPIEAPTGREPGRLGAIRPTARVVGAMPAPAVGFPPAERVFQILERDGDPASSDNYRPVRGRLRAAGRWVQVYVDERDLARVGSETLRDLVATFEGKVLPTAAREFGPARDVDGDGRFTVLVTGRLAQLGGGRLAVDGVVRGADFDAALEAPFGNRCDMMYLSAGLRAGPYLRTVLAHEYTHAVVFCRKVADDPGRPGWGKDEEGWLDEGCAHLVEDLHGFSRENLDFRVSAFLSAPERYRLVVGDYYTAGLFRSHGNRGATYLFLRWCADRYGPGLLPALVGSPKTGVENLEAATGTPFEALYRRWSASVFLDGISPGAATERPPRPSSDEWLLAGPRTAQVEPGGEADVWSACGTTSHYAVVGASPTGAVEIEVRGPAEGQIQVTVARLPDNLPTLSLAMRLRRRPGGDPEATATVGLGKEGRVRLEALGWERLVPRADPHAPGFRQGRLSGRALEAALGGLDLAPGERRESTSIPLRGATAADGPIVFKLVGKDGRGRRVVGWAEVDPAAVFADAKPDEVSPRR